MSRTRMAKPGTDGRTVRSAHRPDPSRASGAHPPLREKLPIPSPQPHDPRPQWQDKKGLVTGIAYNTLIAWGIAQQLHAATVSWGSAIKLKMSGG